MRQVKLMTGTKTIYSLKFRCPFMVAITIILKQFEVHGNHLSYVGRRQDSKSKVNVLTAVIRLSKISRLIIILFFVVSCLNDDTYKAYSNFCNYIAKTLFTNNYIAN